ncbi:metallophosphoesterase family protein [Sphingobacterium wenxiniae]|uniref:Calcineurin-like phosphoesterase n=1 Tax=Sphingobacterium wenxiniae TaxID=683125 RepID=A0A1I6QK94_9SPHI|nr:metallophosphoesterase [Sphingobacterium wenxiniae]SFS52876.1 Calcineurin-like phosphoesterase [Sphingobacterium wenxiniae]
MYYRIYVLLLFFTAFFFSACKRNFQYSVLEVRPLDREINQKSIAEINQLSPKDTFSFLIMSDSQVAYKPLESFVRHVNKTYAKDSVAFILHAGDFTDYGANFEYNLYHELTEKLNFPVVGCIGNHDMLGNGQEIYRKFFGPENFTFTYGANRFILFNNNGREVGFNGTLPDLSWLNTEILNAREDNLFFISHVPPMSDDFDPALRDDFVDLLAVNKSTRLSIHGHTHSFEYGEFFNDGVPYLVVPTLLKKEYVKVTVFGNEILVQQKYF